MERATGREFGNPDRPLLLAVRSGATISMPGMMATLFNVGINEEIVEGLARSTGEAWFAWDNYRRFIQSWGMSFGMEREVFSGIMNFYKAKYGVEKKRQFSGGEMKELALAYRRGGGGAAHHSVRRPVGPAQIAIQQVFDSWTSSKARQYREIMGISDSWGTAVIVQAMVFGNLGLSSGSGVVFTAHPYRKIRRVALWGDFTPGNQGEDIVGGLVSTYPHFQGAEGDRGAGRAGGGHVPGGEFPAGVQAALRYRQEPGLREKMEPAGSGIHLRGARRKRISTSSRPATWFPPSGSPSKSSPRRRSWRRASSAKGSGSAGAPSRDGRSSPWKISGSCAREDPETPLILVRSDTVPEDVQEISLTEGLLTAKGGQTSHAAIVAFELDKTAIVGCRNLTVLESEGRCLLNRTEIKKGDFISLDGRKGLVYSGKARAPGGGGAVHRTPVKNA